MVFIVSWRDLKNIFISFSSDVSTKKSNAVVEPSIYSILKNASSFSIPCPNNLGNILGNKTEYRCILFN